VALVTERGEQIGYLVWRPELPGTVLLRVLAPVTALAVLLTLLALGLLARSLRRSTQELEASRAQAQHLAFHDVLTGLPNRALYNDRLDHALAQARRGCKVAVLALDLDRFKHVNDTLGHHAGDALIREFARRLDDVVRDGDTVARLGGDEFAIALTSHQATDVEAVCQRILDAVRQPFDLFGSNAFVGVSIGVVHAPSDGLDRIELMRKADIALYRAKGEGRDCYRIFTAAMDDTVRLRGTIEDELRTALETGDGLQVHYQPQVAGGSRSVVGLEALVRWEHPKRGLIAPDQFISVAEETGLICQLGEWVLREACSTACRYPELFMAVNLSPVQFRTTGFADKVVDIVRTSGADPRRIELEVTESVLLDDDEPVRTALKTLRSAGLRIALDDFGTGYSSLSYLKRFEVDKIKIDKSFIQHLGQTADSAAIVTAVVTLGHAMGLAVTAEGVETEEQKQFLAAAGCTTMQGYLFSRALPEKQLASVLPDHGRNILVA
jgi:diguanylate cyclase (GGDEF)-like protein